MGSRFDGGKHYLIVGGGLFGVGSMTPPEETEDLEEDEEEELD